MKNSVCVVVKPFLIIALLFAMLTVSGCASFNPFRSRGISDAEVARIHRQYTTENDILNMFGQPYIKTTQGANWQRWTYHTRVSYEDSQKAWYHKLFKEKARDKTLIILFNNGIVRDYRYIER
ncbi:MAG: hypothetical protein CENE_03482 [Candidatus Celerinatantimonas neptuna]|nr:MAG: hypothetical protein CENE_03482 [Candidatus Celerinatantimonas neptuna]